MRVRSRARSLIILIALLLLGREAAAGAPDWPKWTLFSGLDARGEALFANAGFKVSPFESRGNQVLVVQGLIGGGRRSFVTSATPDGVAVKDTRFATLMAGAQASFGTVYVAGYLGPEWRDETPVGALARDRSDGSRIGLRGQADLWWHPTPSSLVTGVVIASSAKPSIYARASAGLALAEGVYAGPEASISAGRDHEVARLGLHLTGLRLFGSQFFLGGGAAFEEGRRPGAYGSLAQVRRF